MAILVTGGAGFVGSVTVERLLDEGESVVVFDDFSTGHRGAISPAVPCVEGSICNRILVEKTLREFNVDTVIHCAGKTYVDESNRSPLDYFEVNTVGAHTLLQAMIATNVTRFVFSSTASVYGETDGTPIDELHGASPINAYGCSKRMTEEMLEWTGRAYGLRFISLRYFNAAGATERCGEDHRPETHIIPIAIDAARQAREVLIFGGDHPTPDGTCIRDYVHVGDIADAHLNAVTYLRDGGTSEFVNVGSGTGNSVLEVVESVRVLTELALETRIAPPRAGDPPVLVASIEKAGRVLDWRPRRSDIDRIVSDAWRWRRTHPEGYHETFVKSTKGA